MGHHSIADTVPLPNTSMHNWVRMTIASVDGSSVSQKPSEPAARRRVKKFCRARRAPCKKHSEQGFTFRRVAKDPRYGLGRAVPTIVRVALFVRASSLANPEEGQQVNAS